MSPECVCGCSGDRHRGEQPYPCMDCACDRFVPRLRSSTTGSPTQPEPEAHGETWTDEEIKLAVECVEGEAEWLLPYVDDAENGLDPSERARLEMLERISEKLLRLRATPTEERADA